MTRAILFASRYPVCHVFKDREINSPIHLKPLSSVEAGNWDRFPHEKTGEASMRYLTLSYMQANVGEILQITF